MSDVPAPVRRYLDHALPDGEPPTAAVHLTMRGRIKVGVWLPFTAEQEIDGSSFAWRARAAGGLIHVADSFADGAGLTEGRLFGRRRLFRADDENTARSAAGRAACEAVFAPAALVPAPGVEWTAQDEETIVVTRAIGPERPPVTLKIGTNGAVRSVSMRRWGKAGQKDFGYIPFGARITGERRFGDLVIPSQLEVVWWFGTPREAPFFRAEILSAAPAPARPRAPRAPR